MPLNLVDWCDYEVTPVTEQLCIHVCRVHTLQIITQESCVRHRLIHHAWHESHQPLGRKCSLQMWSWDCSFRRTLDEEVFMGITRIQKHLVPNVKQEKEQVTVLGSEVCVSHIFWLTHLRLSLSMFGKMFFKIPAILRKSKQFCCCLLERFRRKCCSPVTSLLMAARIKTFPKWRVKLRGTDGSLLSAKSIWMENIYFTLS